MTSQGPWDPEVETLREYVHRIVANAPPPTPEQAAHLRGLLQIGAPDGGHRDINGNQVGTWGYETEERNDG